MNDLDSIHRYYLFTKNIWLRRSSHSKFTFFFTKVRFFRSRLCKVVTSISFCREVTQGAPT